MIMVFGYICLLTIARTTWHITHSAEQPYQGCQQQNQYLCIVFHWLSASSAVSQAQFSFVSTTLSEAFSSAFLLNQAIAAQNKPVAALIIAVNAAALPNILLLDDMCSPFECKDTIKI